MADLPDAQWFWDKVDIRGPEECWLWMGNVRSKESPYGRFFISRQSVQAHRFSLLLSKGPPPRNSDQACHSCDNPRCVNPSHLWWGTALENVQDCVAKGRKQFPNRRKIDRSLVREMRANGATLKEIAEHIGVNPSSISKALYKIGAGGALYGNQHRKPLRARAAAQVSA